MLMLSYRVCFAFLCASLLVGTSFVSSYASPLFDSALSAQRSGKTEEAITLFNQVIAAEPENARAYLSMSQLLAKQGKNKAAQSNRDKVISLLVDSVAQNPTSDDYYFLGTAYRFSGDLQKALTCYDQSLALNAKNSDALVGRAAVLNALDKPQDALVTLYPQLAVAKQKAGALNQQIASVSPEVIGGAAFLALEDSAGKPENLQDVKLTQDALEVGLVSNIKEGNKKGAESLMLIAQELYPAQDWNAMFQDKLPRYRQSVRTWYGFDDLSNQDRGNWNEQGIDYSITTPDNKNKFRAGMIRNERFDNTDLSYTAGYSRKVTDKVNTFVDFTAGPGNRIVPQFIAQPGVSVKLPYGLTATSMYRFFQFSSQSNSAGIHSIEKSIKPLGIGVGYTVRHSHLENVSKVPVAHSVFANKYYRNNSIVSGSFTVGEGVEFFRTPTLPQGRAVAFDTIGFSFGGTHFLTPKSPWGVNWGIHYQNMEGFFGNLGYTVGLQRNF